MAELFNVTFPTDLSEVSTVIGSGNTIAWESGTGLDGANAAKITLAGNTNVTYIYKTFTQYAATGQRYLGVAFHAPTLLSMTMGASDSYWLLTGRAGAGNTIRLGMVHRVDTGVRYLRTYVRDDNAVDQYGTNTSIASLPDWIYILWTSATSASANDGTIKLYFDEVLKDTRSGLDMFTEFIPDRVELGAIYSLGVGTSGSLTLGPWIARDDATEITTPVSATAPGAPTGLTVSHVGGTQLALSWTAPASDGGSAITGYKIERETPTGNGFSTLVADTGDTSTTYTNTSLSLNTQYNYRVSAINAIGTSSASSSAAQTTPTALIANITFPTDLSEVSTTIGASNTLVRNATAGINGDPGIRIGLNANENTFAYYTIAVPLALGSDTGFGIGFHGGSTLTSLSMGTDDATTILQILGDSSADRLGVILSNTDDVREATLYLTVDLVQNMASAVSVETPPEWIDIVVVPSSAIGVADGSVKMYFDWVLVSALTDVDTSDFDYETVRFGFPTIATDGGSVTGTFDMGPLRAYRDTTQASSLNPFGNIISPPGAVGINAGDTVYFEGDASVGFGGSTIDTHLWTFGSGSGIANASSEVPGEKTFSNAGTFTVTYIVTDNQGLVSANSLTRRITVTNPAGSSSSSSVSRLLHRRRRRRL